MKAIGKNNYFIFRIRFIHDISFCKSKYQTHCIVQFFLFFLKRVDLINSCLRNFKDALVIWGIFIYKYISGLSRYHFLWFFYCKYFCITLFSMIIIYFDRTKTRCFFHYRKFILTWKLIIGPFNIMVFGWVSNPRESLFNLLKYTWFAVS